MRDQTDDTDNDERPRRRAKVVRVRAGDGPRRSLPRWVWPAAALSAASFLAVVAGCGFLAVAAGKNAARPEVIAAREARAKAERQKTLAPTDPDYVLDVNDPSAALGYNQTVGTAGFGPASGNVLIDGDPATRKKAAVDKLIGKTVRWPVEVKAVDAAGKISFAFVSWPMTRDEWYASGRRDERDCHLMHILFAEKQQPPVNLAKSKALRQGDKLVVVGTLESIIGNNNGDAIHLHGNKHKQLYVNVATITNGSIVYP